MSAESTGGDPGWKNTSIISPTFNEHQYFRMFSSEGPRSRQTTRETWRNCPNYWHPVTKSRSWRERDGQRCLARPYGGSWWRKLKRPGRCDSLELMKIFLEIIKFFQDHAAIAEIYNSNITTRCGDVNEDITRMYKKCREITFEIHEEILKVLHELHTAMKTNHTYQSEFRQGKLRQGALWQLSCRRKV